MWHLARSERVLRRVPILFPVRLGQAKFGSSIRAYPEARHAHVGEAGDTRVDLCRFLHDDDHSRAGNAP